MPAGEGLVSWWPLLTLSLSPEWKAGDALAYAPPAFRGPTFGGCPTEGCEQVDRGLYRLPDAPATERHSVAQVAKRVRHATVALLSALQIHSLTSEAVPRHYSIRRRSGSRRRAVCDA
jgi:hypothetical protein